MTLRSLAPINEYLPGTFTLNQDNHKTFQLNWILASINVQNRFATLNKCSTDSFILSSLKSHATQQLIIWQLLWDKQLRYVIINALNATESGVCSKPSSVVTAGFFSLDLGVFCFFWGSGVFIDNLGFLTLVKFCIFHWRIQRFHRRGV